MKNSNILAWICIFTVLGLVLVVHQWTVGWDARGRGGDAVATSTTSTLDMLVETAYFAALPLLICISPWRRVFGVALPAPQTGTRLLRATVLVFTCQYVTGYIASSLISSTSRQTRLDTAFQNQSFLTGAVGALRAAICEETRNVVIPTAAVVLAIAAWCRFSGRGFAGNIGTAVDTPARWRRWIGIACCIGLITRVTDHLYQGGVSAAMAIVWGAALLVIYLQYRTVLPLMLGHLIFDLFVATSAWAEHTSWVVLLGGAWLFAGSLSYDNRRRRTPSWLPRQSAPDMASKP